MVSPYLKRPLRSLDEILSEVAGEGEAAAASPIAFFGKASGDARAEPPAQRRAEDATSR